MKVWMLWHQPGWGVPEVDRDTEEFDSLRAARDAFWRRADYHPAYPCVHAAPPPNGPEAQIFFYDPRGERDPYPDRLMSFGPRGGVRTERC